MKICIISDSHDRAPMLAAAVKAAKAEGAEAVVHCGDVIGAMTLRPLLDLGLPVHVIHGNNLGDSVMLHRLARESGGLIQYHGADARIELGGRKIFLVHYPDYGYAMACTGEWDLVCCGHSHCAGIEQVDERQGGNDLASQSRHGGGARSARDMGSRRPRVDAIRNPESLGASMHACAKDRGRPARCSAPRRDAHCLRATPGRLMRPVAEFTQPMAP